VPQVKFSFVPLNQLTDVEKDSICDVIGVVKEVGELGSITSKATQKSVGLSILSCGVLFGSED
jgi:replication factor A1